LNAFVAVAYSGAHRRGVEQFGSSLGS
jgi:hypothetical protein